MLTDGVGLYHVDWWYWVLSCWLVVLGYIVLTDGGGFYHVISQYYSLCRSSYIVVLCPIISVIPRIGHLILWYWVLSSVLLSVSAILYCGIESYHQCYTTCRPSYIVVLSPIISVMPRIGHLILWQWVLSTVFCTVAAILSDGIQFHQPCNALWQPIFYGIESYKQRSFVPRQSYPLAFPWPSTRQSLFTQFFTSSELNCNRKNN